MIDESGKETGVVSRKWKGSISFEQLLADNAIGNGSLVVARRAALSQVGRFDEDFGACHDLDFWLRIALLRQGNIVCIPGFLTYYRQRPDQLTKNVKLMEDSWYQVLEKMRGIAPRQTAFAAAKGSSNVSRYYAYLKHESGDYRAAATYLLRSFRYAPVTFLSDLRSWKMLAANATAIALPGGWYRR